MLLSVSLAAGCAVAVPAGPARLDRAPMVDPPPEPAEGITLPPRLSKASWSTLVKAGREELRLRKFGSAEQTFTEAYQLTSLFSPSDPRTMITVKNLERVAIGHFRVRHVAGFERVMSLLAEVSVKYPRSRTPELASLFRTLAATFTLQERHVDARIALERALQIMGDRNRESDPALVGLHAQLGTTYLELQDEKLGRYHIQLALGIAETAEGTEGPLYAKALIGKSRLELLAGEHDQAEADLLEALRIDTNYYGDYAAPTAAVVHELATFYGRLERHAEARDQFQRVIEIWDGLPSERFQQALSRNDLAWLLVEIGEPERAEDLAREALDLLEDQEITGQPLASVSDTLATALRDQQKYDEAEPLYELALAESAAEDTLPGWNSSEVEEHYAALLEATGRTDEAAKLLGTDTSQDDDPATEGSN